MLAVVRAALGLAAHVEGERVVVVFGAPIDFGDLLAQGKSPKVHQAISDRAMAAVAELGQEERALRAARGSSLVVEK